MAHDRAREGAIARGAAGQDGEGLIGVGATQDPVDAQRPGRLDGAQLGVGRLRDHLEHHRPAIGVDRGGQGLELLDGRADVLESDIAQPFDGSQLLVHLERIGHGLVVMREHEDELGHGRVSRSAAASGSPMGSGRSVRKHEVEGLDGARSVPAATGREPGAGPERLTA